ncbi:Urease accessory protein UreG [Bienertia sinuspersici]
MVETNLFVLQFSSKTDKEKVMHGRPWFFDNQLLVLKEINGDDQSSKRNGQFAWTIGNCMGGFS